MAEATATERVRVVVVGGVAGGASVAARLRRLQEDCEIVILEKGRDVSFANCGLPFMGVEIMDPNALRVMTPAKLHARFGLTVHTCTEVVSVDRNAKTVRFRRWAATETDTGKEEEEGELSYDYLVLSTGCSPIVPPIAGADKTEAEGHFVVRNIQNAQAIDRWVTERHPERVVVCGGGFVGVEMAEQLHNRGLEVTLVEGRPQILMPFDREMAVVLQKSLTDQGIELCLGNMIRGCHEPTAEQRQAHPEMVTVVELDDGSMHPADMVIMALGVRPESSLATAAGLDTNARGYICVDDFMQTSDPCVYAVGDVVEIKNAVLPDQRWTVALAGPANRQGRIAADNISSRMRGGENRHAYRGSLGTCGVRVFDTIGASTGLQESFCRRNRIPYMAVHSHSASHASYYPGASLLHIKLIFDPESGRVLGGQAVGREGAARRIDLVAAAMANQLTVSDVAEFELTYAPPFGSAKDPINLAGMVAENALRGIQPILRWDQLRAMMRSARGLSLDSDCTEPPFPTPCPTSFVQVGELDGTLVEPRPEDASAARFLVLDVREPKEYAGGHIPGAVNAPLSQLRSNTDIVDRILGLDLFSLVIHCRSGQRSYYALCYLTQSFKAQATAEHVPDVRNLTGSWETWKCGCPDLVDGP